MGAYVGACLYGSCHCGFDVPVRDVDTQGTEVRNPYIQETSCEPHAFEQFEIIIPHMHSHTLLPTFPVS
jgi:hypothetical protein